MDVTTLTANILRTVNSYVSLACGQDLTLEDDYFDFRETIMNEVLQAEEEDA